MRKSKSEVIFLQNKIYAMLEKEQRNLLSAECRKYKIPSAYAVEVLKYIYPNVRQSRRVPIIIVKWLYDEYLLDKENRQKYLDRMPQNEVNEYTQYRIGREIKVRYRFRDKTRKYQDIRLTQNYCLGLYKYLKVKGY